jgi:carbohydrate-selective porin OprB
VTRRLSTVVAVASLAAVILATILRPAAVRAQEGFPLVGTWYGDWGPSPARDQRHDVTIVMTWDGKTIGGTIDPGPDAVPFKTATLDSSTWSVHIEAERAAKGAVAAVRYVIDGKLANLGSYNRTLSGTWTSGTAKGDFKLTRD